MNIPRGPGGSCKASCDLFFEVSECHFYNIPLVKQVTKANPDLRGRGVGSISSRKELNMCTDREGCLPQHEWLYITEASSLFRNLCHCQGAEFLAFETLGLRQFTFPGSSSTIVSHSSLPQSTPCFSLLASAYAMSFSAKAFPHSLLPNQSLPHWAPAQIPPAPVPPLTQTISNFSELILHHWLGSSRGAVH